jgi:hypothetical protein
VRSGSNSIIPTPVAQTKFHSAAAAIVAGVLIMIWSSSVANVDRVLERLERFIASGYAFPSGVAKRLKRVNAADAYRVSAMRVPERAPYS